jgi:hypothetical protein
MRVHGCQHGHSLETVTHRLRPSALSHPLALPALLRDNLFQAFAIQSDALRRTLTFADLLPLAAQLLHGLPSHVMQVVKMVGMQPALHTRYSADVKRQVVDKRGNDRCCFDHFVAVVGLCGDVRRLHDTACWIFHKVALQALASAPMQLPCACNGCC